MNRETDVIYRGISFHHHPAGSGDPSDKFNRVILKNSDLLTGEVLLVECGTGVIGATLTNSSSVTTVNSSYIDYSFCKKNISSGENIFGTVRDFSNDKAYDSILFRVTKSQSFNREVIAIASTLLTSGGSLYIAGTNGEGIKSIEKLLSQTAPSLSVAVNGGGGRILKVEPSDMSVETAYETTLYKFKDGEISVRTSPGLFSHGKVDKGTQLLLDVIPGLTGKKVLDLGCGSGILSIAAVKSGATEVVATDLSSIACCDSRYNTKELNEIEIIPSYIGDAVDGKFQVVLTNPPFHEGFNSNYSIGDAWLSDMRRVIDKRTVVYLVANNFLPYGKISHNFFEDVSIVKEADGFSVYRLSGVKS